MTTAYTSFPFSEPQPEGDALFYERSLEKQGFTCVGGVDEAGRGPLAGPVVAACVVLPIHPDSEQYQDSKQLTASCREELYARLREYNIPVGVGIVDARDIERVNILQAALLAMKIAVTECNRYLSDRTIDFLLVDGKFTVPLAVTQSALVKGDSRSRSIAAASIIAKVTRDRIMADYHQKYPQYNFIRNQGYPTAEHRQAIRQYGPCPIHRRTFKGVREYITEDDPGSTSRQQSIW